MTSVPNLALNNGVAIPAIGLGVFQTPPDVFDFELTPEELAAIDGLETGVRGGPEPDFITLDNFSRPIPEA